MAEASGATETSNNIGTYIIDTLLDLLEHQTGVRYSYEEIKKEDKTA